MSTFIAAEEGAIGYIDAGHGHSKNLFEIELKNKDKLWVDTKKADIGAAATVALDPGSSIIPSEATADFSDVKLFDVGGPTTFPITMITYLYVPANLSTMDPEKAGLLIYFIKFVLGLEGTEGPALLEKNKFEKLPSALAAYNQVTLASLVASMPDNAPVFSTEYVETTRILAGAGDYVISEKRSSWAEVQRTSIATTIAEGVGANMKAPGGTDDKWDEDTLAAMAIAGLALGALGAIIGVGALCIALASTRKAAPRSAEVALPVRNLSVPSHSSETANGLKKDAV